MGRIVTLSLSPQIAFASRRRKPRPPKQGHEIHRVNYPHFTTRCRPSGRSTRVYFAVFINPPPMSACLVRCFASVVVIPTLIMGVLHLLPLLPPCCLSPFPIDHQRNPTHPLSHTSHRGQGPGGGRGRSGKRRNKRSFFGEPFQNRARAAVLSLPSQRLTTPRQAPTSRPWTTTRAWSRLSAACRAGGTWKRCRRRVSRMPVARP